LEIVEQRGFRFEVVVPSEDVGHLQVGMPARIKVSRHVTGDEKEVIRLELGKRGGRLRIVAVAVGQMC
jgi:hypothetical protein